MSSVYAYSVVREIQSSRAIVRAVAMTANLRFRPRVSACQW